MAPGAGPIRPSPNPSLEGDFIDALWPAGWRQLLQAGTGAPAAFGFRRYFDGPFPVLACLTFVMLFFRRFSQQSPHRPSAETVPKAHRRS